MRVLLLSRYGSLGASSRVRYLQYLPYLRTHGLDVKVMPLFPNSYLHAFYAGGSRFRDALDGYIHRVGAVMRARRFEVLIIEKEIFPFLPAWAEGLLHTMGVPYLADYDDALFHRYDQHPSALVRRLFGRKIDGVMRNASVVVTGNEYLAKRARKAGAVKLKLIPTVVDMERYYQRQGPANETPVVGWIGMPRTSRYLQRLLPVFRALQREMPVRFVAVGARAQDFVGTPVEAWPWSLQTEVASIQKFDIGIMPLDNNPWERGKCGYKLIQYMACGLPVVASPVGVNLEIVSKEENGFLAETEEDWQQALGGLLQRSAKERRAIGAAGRRRVDSWYSLRVQAPRFLAAIKEAAH